MKGSLFVKQNPMADVRKKKDWRTKGSKFGGNKDRFAIVDWSFDFIIIEFTI